MRHDVVIVGAGLAGLSAAHALRGRDLVVLEQDDRPGGRVLTRRHAGVAYDLGALFASPDHLGSAPRPAQAHGPVGLFYAGTLHLARDVIACIRAAGLSEEQMDALLEFRQTYRLADLAPDARAIANAFFQVIYPGTMQDYVAERRADALRTLAPAYHEQGNDVLVQQLAAPLEHRLVLGATVRRIDDRGDDVQVAYDVAGERRVVTARAAVVCTPAPIARALLARLNDEARYFLDRVEYRGGLVVVLAYPRTQVPAFSYLVTVDGRGAPSAGSAADWQRGVVDAAPSTVIRQDRGETCVLTCYYVGAQARALAEQPRDQIIRQTLDAVAALGLGVSPAHLQFADVQHWPMIGPVLSEPMRAYHHPRALRPSERVFLAGDYTYGTELPYGMAPALQSGRRAATAIEGFLQPPVTAPRARMAPLVEAYRYRLQDDRPVFLDRRAEGDVAFYGLILQAEPGDEALRDYLLSQRRDGLWEYHDGYGVTAEDSTLVIEGLWRAGVARDVLQASLARLVARCFDEPTGAFHTIPHDRRGRAGYWRGASIDATAHAGYLLHALAADEHATIVERCLAHLRARQAPDGRFVGTWFPSWTWTTYHAVRLLQAAGEVDAAQRAHWALLRGQADDGSWQRSVIDTSAAVLALEVLDPDDPAIARGRAWLRGSGDASPEAVLYYWFEPPPGAASTGAWYDGDGAAPHRVFFHAMDRGRITHAWARLALQPG